MMNSAGTSASTLKELNRELLEEMDNFIDTLPTKLPERGHHDEFVFICLYRYARDLAVDLTLLIEATTIAVDTFNSVGMHMLCRSLLVTCIDTYYIKVDPLERAKRYMDYNVWVAHPHINDSEEEQERKKKEQEREKELEAARLEGAQEQYEAWIEWADNGRDKSTRPQPPKSPNSISPGKPLAG